MKIIIILFILVFHLNLPIHANENICKKFDIKCITQKYVSDTMEFQNKKWSETKRIQMKLKKSNRIQQ